jgi:predicted dehydrogenase
MEAMWMRFLPLVRRARELIAEGIVGDVVGLSADFSAPSDLTGPGNRFADPEVGSGALLDRGIYGLSFASLLLGQPTEVVGMATLTEAALDLRSSILMKFDGGATAVITASLTTQGANTAVVEGTRGTLLLHAPFYRPERLTVRRLAAPASGPLAPPRRPSLATRVKGHPLARRLLLPLRARLVRPAIDIVQPIAGTGYQHEVAEVVRCLQGGLTESPLAPLDESVRLMEAMDTLRERWQRGAGR